MNCSPARLAANRINASKSTGPRTEEGKAASRGNALKHGLAGEGIALPAEDAAEVERRFLEIEAELRPDGAVAHALARRVALLSIRMERCVVHESAAISDRVRSAEGDFDEARTAEVARLIEDIDADPAAHLRQLRRMPEGVDRLIAIWLALKADLTCTAEDRWRPAHRLMAENLSGRRPGDFGIGRVEALARAIRGDFTHLTSGEGAGLDDRARAVWARERMGELIDSEVEALRAHRATLDLEAIDRSRAGAASRALFDGSKEAQLARRYEAAAERGFYRALRELRRLPVADPAYDLNPTTTPAALAATATADLLASFRAAEASGFLPPRPAEKRRPDPVQAQAHSQARPTTPARLDHAGPARPRDASTIVVGRAR